MCLRGSPIRIVSTKQKLSLNHLAIPVHMFYPNVFTGITDRGSQYKTKVIISPFMSLCSIQKCLRGSPIGIVSTKQKLSFRRSCVFMFYPKVFTGIADRDSQYNTKVIISPFMSLCSIQKCLQGSPITIVSTKQKESFRRSCYISPFMLHFAVHVTMFYPKVFTGIADHDS